MRNFTVLVLFALCAAQFQHAAAQAPGSYPSRPIRMILPASPGGPVDVIGRTVGMGLAEALGQPIVMDNRAGAGGIIGAEIVARGTPDGYTLMFAHSGPLAIEAAIHSKLSYHPLKDFAPVSLVAASPYALIVSPASPAKSVKDLVALARSRTGKFHFASGGIGTGIHMAGELLNVAAGIRMSHVPYKGAAPSMTESPSATMGPTGRGAGGAVAGGAVVGGRVVGATVVAVVATRGIVEVASGSLERRARTSTWPCASSPPETARIS